MYDYVLVLFVGVALGFASGYTWVRSGKWSLDELVEAADQVLHNTHLQAHLKANPDLKKTFGELYDWVLEHGGQPIEAPKKKKVKKAKKKDDEE